MERAVAAQAGGAARRILRQGRRIQGGKRREGQRLTARSQAAGEKARRNLETAAPQQHAGKPDYKDQRVLASSRSKERSLRR